jgi:hypothetical protein
MGRTLHPRLWSLVLVLGATARAQTSPPTALEIPAANANNQPASSPTQNESDNESSQSDNDSSSSDQRFFKFRWPLSQEEDPDGPINTDRPTFTPSKAVVPRGRLQFESGFTYNYQQSATTRSNLYDFPELAMRFGLADRVEFRMFWLGQTWSSVTPRRISPAPVNGGLSDMEVGFKWQLVPSDRKKKWIPMTALITSVFAPTGGTSKLGAHTVEPYANLIYGWDLFDNKLTLMGSTGYLGMRETDLGHGRAADSFERWHQSIVAFYSATKRVTLFYEWYILMFTNAADNRPTPFMDSGLLYQPTPNTQIDLRAGFGLSNRPDDFFTGAGFSWRF